MFDWIKKNKKFIFAVVFSILQNVGLIPPAVDAVVSVDTKQVGE